MCEGDVLTYGPDQQRCSHYQNPFILLTYLDYQVHPFAYRLIGREQDEFTKNNSRRVPFAIRLNSETPTRKYPMTHPLLSVGAFLKYVVHKAESYTRLNLPNSSNPSLKGR